VRIGGLVFFAVYAMCGSCAFVVGVWVQVVFLSAVVAQFVVSACITDVVKHKAFIASKGQGNVFPNVSFLVTDHNIFREIESVEGENYKAGLCKSTVLSLQYFLHVAD